MDDLTKAQEAELDELAWTFIQGRKFDGVDCVIVLKGRGVTKVAYSLDSKDKVAGMLARAYRDASQYNASRAN